MNSKRNQRAYPPPTTQPIQIQQHMPPPGRGIQQGGRGGRGGRGIQQITGPPSYQQLSPAEQNKYTSKQQQQQQYVPRQQTDYLPSGEYNHMNIGNGKITIEQAITRMSARISNAESRIREMDVAKGGAIDSAIFDQIFQRLDALEQQTVSSSEVGSSTADKEITLLKHQLKMLERTCTQLKSAAPTSSFDDSHIKNDLENMKSMLISLKTSNMENSNAIEHMHLSKTISLENTKKSMTGSNSVTIEDVEDEIDENIK